jgi:hypothetical protein
MTNNEGDIGSPNGYAFMGTKNIKIGYTLSSDKSSSLCLVCKRKTRATLTQHDTPVVCLIVYMSPAVYLTT